MNTDKITKKSLLMSGMTLLISVALLASTTFAWFTDSINNSGNTIEAGELQIEVKGWKLNSKRAGWDGPIMQANFDEKHLMRRQIGKAGIMALSCSRSRIQAALRLRSVSILI